MGSTHADTSRDAPSERGAPLPYNRTVRPAKSPRHRPSAAKPVDSLDPLCEETRPHDMPGHLAYRVLAAGTAAVFLLAGFFFFCGFLDHSVFQIFAHPLLDTNAWGYYMRGLAGSLLIMWAVSLLTVARAPTANPGVATATTVGLVLGAVLRLLAWYSGEYRAAGDQLRLESAVLLVLALGFVWLRPPRTTAPSS